MKPGGMEQTPLEKDNWLQFFLMDCILERQLGPTHDAAVTNTPIKVQGMLAFEHWQNLKPIPDSARLLLLFLMPLSLTVFVSNAQRLEQVTTTANMLPVLLLQRICCPNDPCYH
jgi:hypothetical protein